MRIYQLISGNRGLVAAVNGSSSTGPGWRLQANIDEDGKVGDDEVRLITPEGEILFGGRIDGNTLGALKGQIKLDMIGRSTEPAATPQIPSKPAYRAATGDLKAVTILSRYEPVEWTLEAAHHIGAPSDRVEIHLGDEEIGHVPVLPYNSIPGMAHNVIKRDFAKRQAPAPPAPPVVQVDTRPANPVPEPVAQEVPAYIIQGEPIYEIPLARIGHFPGGNQRTVFDQVKLEELAASIRIHGVIQPIVVNEVNGSYLLMAGERRLRASHMAGRPTIPASVRHLSEAEALEVMSIENLQREDLNPIDEAHAYQRLLTIHGSRERVADRLGKSRVHVTEHLQLLDLPAELQKQVATGQISMRAGLEYLRKTKDAPEPVKAKAAQAMAEEKPTARQAPAVIDRVLEQEGVARATPHKREPAARPETQSPQPEAKPAATPAPQAARAQPPAPTPEPKAEPEMATIQVSAAAKKRFDDLRLGRDWTEDQFLEELMSVWEAEGLLK